MKFTEKQLNSMISGRTRTINFQKTRLLKSASSYPEQKTQIEFVKHFRDLQDAGLFGRIPDLIFIELNAIPNFGRADANKQRRKKAGGINKAKGYKKGWPDIEIIWRLITEPRHRTAYIETKSKTGTLDDDQIILHNEFAVAGIPVSVMRAVADGIKFMKELGIYPLDSK